VYTLQLNVINIQFSGDSFVFMVNLHGPIVALLTPFDASGEIEWQAFKTYLSSLYSWGVRTVIANGTTGEFPSLTINERR
jgi:4-hydroxy-tetrahydrodipicolinate synthase